LKIADDLLSVPARKEQLAEQMVEQMVEQLAEQLAEQMVEQMQASPRLSSVLTPSFLLPVLHEIPIPFLPPSTFEVHQQCPR
jgi:hypothetical protein